MRPAFDGSRGCVVDYPRLNKAGTDYFSAEMRAVSVMFYIMGAFVFFQLITGGLRVFGFIDESTHITTGFITFLLAIATLVVAALSKPRSRPAISISAILVVLIFVQGLLGFDYLDTSSLDAIMVHFVNALLIYSAAFSGVVWARRAQGIATGTGTKLPASAPPA